MGPDQDPNQQPPDAQPDQDHSFPGAEPGVGAINTTATMLGMIGGVPLVGSALNMGEGTYDLVTGLMDHSEANDDFAQSNSSHPNQAAVDAGNAAEQESQSKLEHAEGHFINSIPLVGFARAWM